MEPNLKPRHPRAVRGRRKPWLALIIALAMASAIAVLVVNLLQGSLYFYNVDEAVAAREEVGDRRFTLQGTPIGCSIIEGISEERAAVAFGLAFGGVVVDVVHHGDPAELFAADVPVVLDGSWIQRPVALAGFRSLAGDGWHFSSDRMRIKHDNNYINDDNYQSRLTSAQAGTDATQAYCQP